MFLHNEMPTHRDPLAPQDASLLGADAVAEVRRALALRPDSAPTPLHALPGLAAELGVAAIHLKDEGHRLGLGSFKALGGAYALLRLVQAEASAQFGRPVAIEEALSDAVRAVAATMTFACATDGNHGRSVAQGAALMGARAVIFVHAGVSAARAEAIAAFGAEIRRTPGSYDDSVAEASRVAEAEGWTVLSDTSWPGYEAIPGLVMQGYTAMVAEAVEALPAPPTHVFLQAGVGGFAAAVAGHLAATMGDARPHVTLVEPERAACLAESFRAGHAVKVEEGPSTVMAMLECFEPSLVAFRVLERAADAAMTLPEETAPAIMRRLAAPVSDDPAVVAGESGATGLAGAIALMQMPAQAAEIGLGPESRILVFNTEGATDPALYEQIVGRAPDQITAPHARITPQA